MPQVTQCVLLCLLKVLEVMRCVLLRLLEVLEVLGVPEVAEVMCYARWRC